MTFNQSFAKDLITIIYAQCKQGMFQVLHYSFSFQDLIIIPQGKLIPANYIYANVFNYHKHCGFFFQIREINSSSTGLRENSSNQRTKGILKYHAIFGTKINLQKNVNNVSLTCPTTLGIT